MTEKLEAEIRMMQEKMAEIKTWNCLLAAGNAGILTSSSNLRGNINANPLRLKIGAMIDVERNGMRSRVSSGWMRIEAKIGAYMAMKVAGEHLLGCGILNIPHLLTLTGIEGIITLRGMDVRVMVHGMEGEIGMMTGRGDKNPQDGTDLLRECLLGIDKIKGFGYGMIEVLHHLTGMDPQYLRIPLGIPFMVPEVLGLLPWEHFHLRAPHHLLLLLLCLLFLTMIFLLESWCL